jgi:nicotinamide phosphoribosyltransferase
MRYLEGVVITKEKIVEAENFWKSHFGRDDYFDSKKWYYILEKYNGKLPVIIKAVPEGCIVCTENVLMTIECDDPECFWLTNFIETLLVKVWYPITIATQSYIIKKDIDTFLELSGDPILADFKVHDFGYRGVSCEEQAAIGAASHLLSFKGTDTVAGIRFLMKYYNAPMCGFSIPATEHSIICSFDKENETKAYENLLDEFPKGLIACVSDTYNIFNACENIWGGILKDKVMNRDGTLVVRPDSGDPNEVVLKVLDILYDKFGGYVNDKGYKVLDPHVRIIQGDGMDLESIYNLYYHITKNGYSADNLAVGSGGGLLQKVNRDTLKFAFKASSITVNGVVNNNIQKTPITDNGKRSKEGMFKLVYNTEYNVLQTVSNAYTPKDIWDSLDDVMCTVFDHGRITKMYTYDDIQNNIKLGY